MGVRSSVHNEELTAAILWAPYRENRNYIHSADLYHALTDFAQDRLTPEAYLESLVLRREAVRQVRASFQPGPQSLGTFAFRTGEAQVRGWLLETEAQVFERVRYDESRAAAAAVCGRGSARFTEPVPGYTAFEQVIVLMKAASGQVIHEARLCQINLRRPLLEKTPLTLNLRQRIMQRFLDFEILQAGQVIGSVCGSLGSST
jgi:hypothetical protein